MPQVNLESATVEQLKSWAYDQLVTLQQAQNNLAILNKAIESKTSTKEQINGDIDSNCDSAQSDSLSNSGCSSTQAVEQA